MLQRPGEEVALPVGEEPPGIDRQPETAGDTSQYQSGGVSPSTASRVPTGRSRLYSRPKVCTGQP